MILCCACRCVQASRSFARECGYASKQTTPVGTAGARRCAVAAQGRRLAGARQGEPFYSMLPKLKDAYIQYNINSPFNTALKPWSPCKTLSLFFVVPSDAEPGSLAALLGGVAITVSCLFTRAGIRPLRVSA